MSRARIQEGVASFGAEREFQAARQLDIVPARARERHLAVIGRLFAAASSPADLTAQPLRHFVRHWRPWGARRLLWRKVFRERHRAQTSARARARLDFGAERLH